MKIHNKKIIVTAIAFFILGFLLSIVVSNNQKKNEDFSLFWKVWNIMESKYPFDEPESNKKKYSAIAGLVASYGDEHSVFFPPKYSQQFQEEVSGEFGGAGMEINIKEGYLVVVAPLKKSPAEKAGIKAGDIITHIGNEEIYGKDIADIINLIRGEIGSELHVTIVRLDEKESIDITIIRDLIKIPILETQIQDNVFIISLYNFNESSMEAFSDALVEFKKSDKKMLMLDLRNNPGGYLSEAINLLSYFIPQGEILVKEDHGDKQNEYRFDRSKGFSLLEDISIKIGVLINRGSASASEIVAGALKDYQRAVIIGETSYGKGSVQELISLDEETSLKVTVAKWLTPNNKQISKIGIEPDFFIENMNLKDSSETLQEAIIFLEKY